MVKNICSALSKFQSKSRLVILSVLCTSIILSVSGIKTAASSALADDALTRYPVSKVLSSTWERIPGYTWEDIYVIINLVVSTNVPENGEIPVFSLVQTKDAAFPVLLTGWLDADFEPVEFVVYSAEDEKLYELLRTEELVQFDPEYNLFYLPESEAFYCLQENILYIPEILEFAPEPAPLNWFNSASESYSIENIANFISTFDAIDSKDLPMLNIEESETLEGDE